MYRGVFTWKIFKSEMCLLLCCYNRAKGIHLTGEKTDLTSSFLIPLEWERGVEDHIHIAMGSVTSSHGVVKLLFFVATLLLYMLYSLLSHGEWFLICPSFSQWTLFILKNFNYDLKSGKITR
jgi:hypothetical protein